MPWIAPFLNSKRPWPFRVSTNCFWFAPFARPAVWKSTVPLRRSLPAKVFKTGRACTPVTFTR